MWITIGKLEQEQSTDNTNIHVQWRKMSKQSWALLEMGYIENTLAPDTQGLGNLQLFQLIYCKLGSSQPFTFTLVFCCQGGKKRYMKRKWESVASQLADRVARWSACPWTGNILATLLLSWGACTTTAFLLQPIPWKIMVLFCFRIRK